MLKPVDIETVEFRKAALGYSQSEVDEFLDKVIVEFELLCKENVRLNDKVSILEENIENYKNLEETLKNSIVFAEKSARETKYNAEQGAEQIIRDAKIKAADILQDANKKLYELEYKAIRLKNEYDSFKAKLRLLLNTEMEILSNCDLQFENDFENGEETPEDVKENMQ